MKLSSVLLIPILLSTVSFVSAELKSYREDLDNDNKPEFISVHQEYERPDNMLPHAREGIVTVYDPDLEKAFSFSMPDTMGEIEFVSLNKDGFKQIVARSNGGAHYTNFAIYGYKDGKLSKIFEAGTDYGIITDFATNTPTITVEIPNYKQKDWSYADEPDYEMWAWDGKEFKKSKQNE